MLCCSVSFNFYNVPIFRTNPRFFQRTRWGLATVRLQRIETSREGIICLSANCWNKKLLISRRKLCYSGVTTPSKYVHHSISDHRNVDLGAQVLISGFWVGPDIEDGWGFVEAFVRRLD